MKLYRTKMAGFNETTYYSEEIALLQSMFGETIGIDVIASVIESCNGDVNQAADIIISFGKEPNSLKFEEAAAMEFAANDPTQLKSDSTNIPNEPTSRAAPGVDIVDQTNVPSLLSSMTLTVRNEANESAFVQSEADTEKSISDNTSKPKEQFPPTTNISQQPRTNSSITPAELKSLSFSEAFRNTGAIPRVLTDSKIATHKSPRNFSTCPVDIKNILTYHNNGTRTLILMRGVSGSGKTFLSKQIVEYTVGGSPGNYAKHIFSTDDYFMSGGIYHFNKCNLHEAHMINQKKVCVAANKGVSPIIVDNTNTEFWEMEPYVRDGVRNGYIIEIVEPNTPWAKNPNQLSRRNIHNVPRENIIRMLDRYQNVTTEFLLKTLRIKYPANKFPPVIRNVPPFSFRELPTKCEETLSKIVKYDTHQMHSIAHDENSEVLHYKSPDSPNAVLYDVATNASTSTRIERSPSVEGGLQSPEHDLKLQKIKEAQKQIENFERVEQEWDNGESWDLTAKTSNTVSENQTASLDPKPPRHVNKNESLIDPEYCDDWSKISMFMPPWLDSVESKSTSIVPSPKAVETKDGSTCLEFGDWKSSDFKILYTQSRAITDVIPDTRNQRKRLKIMLDKSTSTNDNDMLVMAPECEHKEQHFKAFRRMFKAAPRHQLREIFDNCKSDVNWAVNLILDDYPEWIRNTENNDEESDTEDEPIEECQCLAVYNIIPDVTPNPLALPAPETTPQSPTTVFQKKPKPEMKISESSLQLKRQIENNVTISDNHYSQHYLDLRRRREHKTHEQDNTDNLALRDNTSEDKVAIGFDNATALPETSTPNTSSSDVKQDPSQYNVEAIDLIESDSESESNTSDSLDQLVTVNMGSEFLRKLDDLFGREGFRYPENIEPIVNLPMSVLRQINAHWAMSVSTQMDRESKQTEDMIKQDEDFARDLANKEEQMSKEGQEHVVPTLKEIMDMELAYSIYERNVAEWRNNEPQDLAAKLSREKLYNLFPNLSKEVLSEMLMAHDYNFKATVEILLISTGQTNWLEDDKGIEKFVMDKEMERKAKFLEKENKNLSEVEWPFLKDTERPINLETVNHYRDEAQKHLLTRNAYFEKARQYFAKNSPSAAAFYSQIAALHTKKYEQASSLAAAYLMNYHLKNNPGKDVLDLHFLRVSEAIVNLDLFLDQIILRLRSKNIRSKEVWIITGKGTHSIGGPRIKPAAKRRLLARDIPSKLANGGLIAVVLYPHNKMTNELAVSENS